ncbi:hypothetical protein CLV33_101144 [Jejuia pallidilutea]|uniref:Uncharacterized protein n=1 Tax=Jejuia pallidilutea TaxID=504487 RepID=A0A362XFZ8_9FLAO|nr:hypothetical protein CLV33_101144 [Jejuia pallidilutea]
MKRGILYLILFILPFVIVVIVNESVRPTIEKEGFEFRGVQTINPKSTSLYKCSWNCYFETTKHCKAYHTTFLKPYFKHIDPIYFGIIKSMHSGNSYQLMNVIFLVVLIPLIIFFLLFRSIEMSYKIKALKKNV